ncbi:Uma2 family endonuclease [Calothrix rhizosoleniae]|uniref:Uma2 family endonuclease n=1 Tax=Calothrix rhizosoleniae TaxID=888997 RepID=UPI000B49C08E|nr:Uma2 family endonuclease [Calothrix rhizosoleniae]
MTITTTRRFTLEEYHRLTEIGFFHEDERVELIRGEVMQMAAKGTAHTTCCRNLLRELAKLVAGRAELQCQDPITLPSSSEPEPDFAIVRSTTDNYLSAHPTPKDVLLVIEIADSSLNYDQQIKIPLYAEAGIIDYWIFNLVAQHLECYSEPYEELTGNFAYSVKRIFQPHQVVMLPGFVDLSLDLSRVFPQITP